MRLSHDAFADLTFLPLPLLDSSKEHYQTFSDLYRQSPSDKDRPSRTPTPSEEAKQTDKGRKSLLVCGKVRGTIVCGECCKPRCIYAQSKLSGEQTKEVTRIQDSNLFTCGSPLFPPSSRYENSIVVREALVCSSYMETQYYSSVLVHFPPACYYCGLGEESLVNNEEIQELKQSYAVVYPICFLGSG